MSDSFTAGAHDLVINLGAKHKKNCASGYILALSSNRIASRQILSHCCYKRTDKTHLFTQDLFTFTFNMLLQVTPLCHVASYCLFSAHTSASHSGNEHQQQDIYIPLLQHLSVSSSPFSLSNAPKRHQYYT